MDIKEGYFEKQGTYKKEGVMNLDTYLENIRTKHFRMR